MGINLSNIVENERTINIDFSGENLEVTYAPSALSQGRMNKLQKELDKGEDTDPLAFAQLFCSIVTGWNLEGPLGEGDDEIAAGKPVPMEARYVAWVPTPVLTYITEKVGEDANPKSRKK